MYISDLVWHDVSETGAGFQFSNKISMNKNDLCRKRSLCFANSSEKMRIYFYLYFMIALSIDNAFETSNRVIWKKNRMNKRKSNKLTIKKPKKIHTTISNLFLCFLIFECKTRIYNQLSDEPWNGWQVLFNEYYTTIAFETISMSFQKI